jgi:hypothetical protein
MQTCPVFCAFLLFGTSLNYQPVASPAFSGDAVRSAYSGSWDREGMIAHKVPAQYREYLGKYDLGEHGFFEMTLQEGRLLGELSLRKGLIELFPAPEGKDHFFAKAAPATFVFSRNQQDQVIALVISITGKGDMKGQKKD